MRQITRIFAVTTVVASLCGATASEAAFFGLPRSLITHLDRISFDEPALAPIAHTRFCMQYPTDCQVQKEDFRRRNIALTAERWLELSVVNREVNRDITPERNEGGLLTERWLVSPRAGDCNDYAVTKRHMLLAGGWPSRSLLLAEVVTSWGEHHLVLVVRFENADVVLDNLNANIRPASVTRYEWVRIESPHDPKFWSTVKVESIVSRVAMLGE